MARKNPSYNRALTHGSGTGSRSLVEQFYAGLDKAFPGNNPIPIPPPSQVHPKHNATAQMFIFVDYAARMFAPITLREVGLHQLADDLANLPEITDKKSAEGANYVLDNARDTLGRFVDASPKPFDGGRRFRAAVNGMQGASMAAFSAYDNDQRFFGEHVVSAVLGARVQDNDATWAAVNEMLQAL